MGKSRFIELMAKSMGKTASDEELEELEVFLDKFPHFRKLNNITDAIKSNEKSTVPVAGQADINARIEQLWDRIKKTDGQVNEKEEDNNIKRFVYWKWTAAAIFIATMFSAFFYIRHKSQDNEAAGVVFHKVYVPYGKTMNLVMPDGTKVKLNAGSHFTYPSVFSSTQRVVSLEGEGFFEVTKNPKKPFLVHTAGFTVKVLGTIFNVRAYSNDKSAETTLLRGKVQVELADDPEKRIILSPHEKLTINNQAPVATKQPAKEDVAKIKYEVATLPNISNDTYPENAWVDNKIMFANNDFEDVARQMERKYDVRIIFEDEALKKEQISGVLENESLDTALLFLKQIVALQTKKEGNTVYLSYKNKNK
jgi:ferric-dicitrate binding protein FerR (iron transport regulator)